MFTRLIAGILSVILIRNIIKKNEQEIKDDNENKKESFDSLNPHHAEQMRLRLNLICTHLVNSCID